VATNFCVTQTIPLETAIRESLQARFCRTGESLHFSRVKFDQESDASSLSSVFPAPFKASHSAPSISILTKDGIPRREEGYERNSSAIIDSGTICPPHFIERSQIGLSARKLAFLTR
jgi:hypothetical protein